MPKLLTLRTPKWCVVLHCADRPRRGADNVPCTCFGVLPKDSALRPEGIVAKEHLIDNQRGLREVRCLAAFRNEWHQLVILRCTRQRNFASRFCLAVISQRNSNLAL